MCTRIRNQLIWLRLGIRTANVSERSEFQKNEKQYYDKMQWLRYVVKYGDQSSEATQTVPGASKN